MRTELKYWMIPFFIVSTIAVLFVKIGPSGSDLESDVLLVEKLREIIPKGVELRKRSNPFSVEIYLYGVENVILAERIKEEIVAGLSDFEGGRKTKFFLLERFDSSFDGNLIFRFEAKYSFN